MTEQIPILREWLYVPTALLERGEEASLRTQLVAQSRYLDMETGLPKPPVVLFNDSVKGFLGVPVDFGLRRFKHLGFVDKTSKGEPMLSVKRLPDPNHPSVENPVAQRAFMAQLVKAAGEQYCFLAQAPTGSGKTVCGMYLAGTLKRKLLVSVHLKNIAEEWAITAEKLLGIDKDRIGMFYGSKKDWKDKDVVITLYQTLYRADLPEGFAQSFGIHILDEVHKAGAAQFSKCITRIPASYRIGLSATTKRTDGMDKVYNHHLGSIKAESEANGLPITVHVLKYLKDETKKIWGSTMPAFVKCLSMDYRRNVLLAKVLHSLYQRDRKIIGVSSNRDQLVRINKLLVTKYGVNPFDIGYYVGEHPITGEKVKTAELKKIAEEKRILLATYGMMREGTNIPSLDSGVDLTPESKATQLIGRVRRPLAGKKPAVWYTLVDVGVKRAENMLRSRMKEYNKDATVKVIVHEKEFI